MSGIHGIRAIWGCLVLTQLFGCHSDDVARFGRDNLTFPRKFSIPSPAQQNKYLEGWPNAAVAQFFGHPFRDAVQFAHATNGSMPRPLLVREGNSCAVVAWDNVGFFLDRVETADQCAKIIGLLHTDNTDLDWHQTFVTGRQIQALLTAIDADRRRLPLKVLYRDLDESQLTGECMPKDGAWAVAFAMIEDAVVVEYKYLINAENRIARLRRVLVEGPPSPYTQNGPLTPLEFPKEHRWRAFQFNECTRFLHTAVHLAECRANLVNSGTDGKIAAAKLIAVAMGPAAVDAVPDLIASLRVKDPAVVSAAKDAICSVGIAAIPVLRKACKERTDPACSDVVALLQEIRPRPTDPLDQLRTAANDIDPRIRDAATALLRQLDN